MPKAAALCLVRRAGRPPSSTHRVRGSETASRVYATAAAAQQQHRTPPTSPPGSHTLPRPSVGLSSRPFARHVYELPPWANERIVEQFPECVDSELGTAIHIHRQVSPRPAVSTAQHSTACNAPGCGRFTWGAERTVGGTEGRTDGRANLPTSIPLWHACWHATPIACAPLPNAAAAAE